jgi:hypothetical protein
VDQEQTDRGPVERRVAELADGHVGHDAVASGHDDPRGGVARTGAHGEHRRRPDERVDDGERVAGVAVCAEPDQRDDVAETVDSAE